MDLMQAIEERHAVRSYRDKPLSHEAVAHLEAVIARCNAEGSLRFNWSENVPPPSHGSPHTACSKAYVIASLSSGDKKTVSRRR